MRAKDRLGSDGASGGRPLLLVDVDGVISLFGGIGPVAAGDVKGAFHSIEGIPHFLSSTAAAHLLALADLYELVWASGWEERADEHLPHLLGLPAGIPHVRFKRAARRRSRHSRAHWKLEAIDTYAGTRALAWIDDALDGDCRAWAASREAPTLLVPTAPERGLTRPQAELLERWALSLAAS
jgi:Swiss Army Knife RNA repair-like protein